MSNIVTISRQFGSFGREIGKRLASVLSYKYFDKEVIKYIADNSNLDPKYIEKNSEVFAPTAYALTFGRSFGGYVQSPVDRIQLAQNEALSALTANTNSVVIGRCADYVLQDSNPYKVYIYCSDLQTRIQRCFDREPQGTTKTPKEMEKQIKRIDKERAKYYSFYTGQEWGATVNYNLCIDTAVVDIDTAVNMIALAINNITM